MSSSKMLCRKPIRSKTERGNSFYYYLGASFRPLRLEHLEARRLLSLGSAIAQQLTTYQNDLDTAVSGANFLPIVGGALASAQSVIDGASQEIQTRVDQIGQPNGPATLQIALSDALGSSLQQIQTTSSGVVQMLLQESFSAQSLGLSLGLNTLPIQFQGGPVSLMGTAHLALAIQIVQNVPEFPPVTLNDLSPGLGTTPSGAQSQLMFSLQASIGSGPFTAYVGLLKGPVSATTMNAPPLPAGQQENALNASVYVSSLNDLAGGAGGEVAYSGWANFNLLATNQNPLAAAGDPDFFGIGTYLTMTWSNLDPSATAADPSSLSFTYGNMTLNMGSFLSSDLANALNGIKQYMQPIDDVVNVLQAPIPGIDQLPGMSSYDLIDALKTFDPASGQEVQKIANLVDDVNTILGLLQAASGGSIDYGSFSLAGQNLAGPGAVGQADQNLSQGVQAGQTVSYLSTNNLDNTSWNLLQNIAADPEGVLQTPANEASEDVQVSDSVNAMVSDSSEIKFPFLDNPSSLLGTLFGQNVNLVTVDLSLNIGKSWTGEVDIPIFGPLVLDFTYQVSFDATGNLEAGFDTAGLVESPPDVSDGFYIQGPYNGDPGTNLNLNASLQAGAGFKASAGVVSVSLNGQGGLNANLNISMNPALEGADGKIRFTTLTNNPGSAFEVSPSPDPPAEITANITVVAQESAFGFSAQQTLATLAQVTLWSGSQVNGTAPGQTPPPPSLDALSPTAGPLSGGTVTVYGTNLENVSQVNLAYQINASINGGTPENYTYGNVTESTADGGVTDVTPTSFQVHIPPSPSNTYGFSGGWVEIEVPVPGGGWTSLGSDTYSLDPAPSISSISPALAQGAGVASIDGSGLGGDGYSLAPGTSIEINGQPAIPFGNSEYPDTENQLWILAPAGTGTVPVTVTTPGGTCTANMTYIPQPEVQGIFPTGGAVDVPSSLGETVTIYGQNFANATGVLFYSGPSTVVYNGQVLYYPITPESDNYFAPRGKQAYWAITVQAPYSATAGTVDVIVETTPTGVPPASANLDEAQPPGNWSSPTPADQFTYWAFPVILGTADTSGPLVGGNQVLIFGTNLDGATNSNSTIDFANNLVSNPGTIDGVVDISPPGAANPEYQMTVTAPPQSSPGVMDLVLTTPGGSNVIGPYTYVSPPVFGTMVPGAGGGSGAWGISSPTSGDVQMTIVGSALGSVTAVDFGSKAGTNLSVNGAGTVITVDCPAESAGEVAVSLVSAGAPGGSLNWGSNFYYEGVPSVTGVSPTVLNSAGGTQVTITGTSFYPPSAVNFVNTQNPSFSSPAAYILSYSPTQIVVEAPGGTANDYVTVQTPQGTSPDSTSAEVSFVVNQPTIGTIFPDYAPAVGGTVVDIYGSNLYGVGAVYFAGNGLDEESPQIVSVSSSEIQVTTPLLYPGTYSVTASNGVSSNAESFTVTPSAYITGVSPSSGLVDPGTLVTITGVNILPFEGVLDFGSIALSVLPGATQQQVQVISPSPLPASYEGTTVNLQIFTNYGWTPISSADEFTYVAPGLAVTGLSATSGPVGGGTPVTISGAYLDDATAVDFGGVPAAIVPGSNSDTSIEVTSPAASGFNPGTVDVTVTGEYGTTPVSAADKFTYDATGPVVGGVSPNSVVVNTQTTVTISGAGLSDASAVYFGQPSSGNSATIESDAYHQIVVECPASSVPGAVDVTVVTPDGTSAVVPADQFTYGGVPTISALVNSDGEPDNSGPANYAYWEVDIVGANLTGATQVDFGADAVTDLTPVYNGYGVNAVVPDEGPGTVDVRVVTPYGESAITPADEFTFVPGPFVIGLQTAPYGSTTTNLDGPLTGGASVTIRGIHLADATAVNFGNTPVTTVTFTSYDVSDDDYGAITVASPPSSVAGIVNLTVTSPEGTSPTTPDATFSYAPIPTISGISPASGALAGGNEVAISGTGLGFVTAVDFGGAAASSFGVDGNTLYVDSPAGAALGAVDVTVTTSGGTVTDPSAFTYVPPPVLTGLSVASGAFEGGTPVVITGVDLGDATEVDFGQNPNTGDGNPATILANTDSQIEVVSPQSPTDDAGTFDVTVTTPDGTTAITEPADEFTYTDAPYIAQVSGPLTLNGQAAGYTAGGDTVDITGNDLDGATAVYFGNAPAASFGYDAYGDIVAVSPPGVVGTVDITVTTPVGTSDISPADEYTYVEAPMVSSVSPSLGPLAGGTQVTISGSGLANATGLNFGSLQTYGFTITSDTDTQIVATTPAYSAGTFDVTVVTQYGTSAISPADQFSYEGPPVISGQNVASGSVYGGTLVTISGVSLSAATVDFGSNAATVLSGLSSDSQLVVLSPEASGDAAGPVDVTVTTSYGTATETNGFTYALPPAVTSIFQSTGPTTGGTDVTIYGTNLAGASAVDFGGVPSAYVSENGDGSLTAVSPAGEPSTVDVTVVAPGGTTPTVPADQFTYLPLPVVAAVSPAAGTINGGTTVTISGVGLGGATSIDFIDSQGDDYQAAIQSDSDNTLVVTSPDYGFATTVDITVTTAGGTSATSPADQFNYVYVPTVSSISPTSGLRTGGDTVSIYGTGLADVTSVAFGGAPAPFTINPDGSITAISPPGSDGTVDVTVATDGASSPTSAADQFTYLQPVPAVTGVSPADGAAAGGETVTISGTDLDNASEVDFNGVAGTIVPSSDTATQIMAVVPAGTLGTVDITVTTSGGTSVTTPADQFTGIAAPVVSSTAGAVGPMAGGTDVFIYGSDLDGATAVDFGQTPGTIIVDAATYMIAASPPGSAGAVDITVTTPYGTSATSAADQFTYVAPPITVAAAYSVTQDATLTVSAAEGVLAGDVDPQGLSLSATVLTGPANGTLSFNSDGSFTYTPDSGYLGPDSFTYEASNAYASSAPTTVSITVSPPALTWTGSTGNWTDGTWGAGGSYPGTTVNATVGGSGSVVNVTSDQAAYALAVQSGGQVAVGPGAALSVTTDTSVTGGATLNVDPAGLFSTGGTLTLDTGGSVTGGPVFAATYQLNDGTASASLFGPGGLSKDTGGTVTLSGVNSYAGGTVVDAGTLIVANAGALPDGSSLTVGAGAAFAFGVGQAAASSSAAVPITPTVAASAPAGASVTASAVSTLSLVLGRQVENLSYVPATSSTPAETPVDFAASVSAAKDAPAAATSVAMSSVASDAVFTSYRSAFDPTIAPADNAQSAHPWAWLAASESLWNSSDQNKTTDSATAALDKVLARFGL